MSGSITECYCVFRGLLRPLPFLIPLLIIGFLIASPPSAMAQDADGDGVPDVSDNCVNNANANQENTNISTTDGDKCDGTTFNPSLEASSGAFHASTPLYRARIDTTTGCIKFAANAGIGSTPDEDIGVNPVKGKRHKDDGRGKKRDRDDEDDGRDKRHGRDDDDDDDERDKRYGKRDDEGRGRYNRRDVDNNVIELCPIAVLGLPGVLTPNPSPTATQSTWQAMVLENTHTGFTAVDTHYGTAADGVGLLQEIQNFPALDRGGATAVFKLFLPAGAGFTVDESAQNLINQGKLTIKDKGGKPIIRITAYQCVAFGKPTAIVDDCPTLDQQESPADPVVVDANPPSGPDDNFDFFGLQRLIDELGAPGIAPVCGPSDPNTGIRHHADDSNLLDPGTTAVNIKLRREGHENQADYRIAQLVPTMIGPEEYTLNAACGSGNIDNFAQSVISSQRMGIALAISSLTSANASSTDIYGKHGVAFGEELDVTWTGVTWKLDNSGPNRFDGGSTTTYALLPNDGKTAEFSDAAQVHTGLGFAGSTVNFAGTSNTVECLGGGGGLAMGPGAIVSGLDPCLTSDPINFGTATGRCATDRYRRGSLSWSGTLNINGCMGGLACTESDCTGDTLVANLGDDPNAIDKDLIGARGGLSCSADEGIRISWNVLTNEFLSNVPLDPTCALGGDCTPCTVGDGSCLPKTLAVAHSTGLCNLDVDRVLLTAQSDPTKPAGNGLSCGMKAGKCEIGAISNVAGVCTPSGDLPASRIVGFETGISLSGGANVDPVTGEGLQHDDVSAVPPLKACIRNAFVWGNETALSTGGNSDAEVHDSTLANSQYNQIVIGNNSANIATVASIGCPASASDPTLCQSRGRDYFSPNTGIGEEDYLAAISGGVTVPSSLRVTGGVIGCDCTQGSPTVAPDCDFNTASSGLQPILPNLEPGNEIDPVNFSVNCDPLSANSDLTMFGTPACGTKVAIGIVKGPDMLLFPPVSPNPLTNDLLQIGVDANNICISSPVCFHDNRDNPSGTVGEDWTSTCLVKNGSCVTDETVCGLAVGNTGNPESGRLVQLESAGPVPGGRGIDTDGDGTVDIDEVTFNPDDDDDADDDKDRDKRKRKGKHKGKRKHKDKDKDDEKDKHRGRDKDDD